MEKPASSEEAAGFTSSGRLSPSQIPAGSRMSRLRLEEFELLQTDGVKPRSRLNHEWTPPRRYLRSDFMLTNEDFG